MTVRRVKIKRAASFNRLLTIVDEVYAAGYRVRKIIHTPNFAYIAVLVLEPLEARP